MSEIEKDIYYTGRLIEGIDCNNYDNGVYYIDDDFNIVKQTDGMEFK